MPEYSEPASPENYEADEAQKVAVFELTEMIEGFARLYSEDYDEEFEDGLTVERGTTELGGDLMSKIRLEVSRLRGSLSLHPLLPGEVQMTQYVITSTVREEGIPYATLPAEVYEYIDQFDDFNTADYNDTTPVALEYEQGYVVNTDGEFMYENSLSIYVDGEGVTLPANAADLLPEEDDETNSPAFDPKMFADIFSEDEMTSLLSSTRGIEEDHRFNHPVYRFYELMDEIADLSKEQRALLAGNIVKSMFTVDAV